ncbi:MAG: hypothetical protein ABIK23_06555 [candidate division WOR-3 bacterium]
MNFSGVFVVVGLLILSVTAEARTGFSDFALKESLNSLPPNLRFYELERMGFRCREGDVMRYQQGRTGFLPFD